MSRSKVIPVVLAAALGYGGLALAAGDEPLVHFKAAAAFDPTKAVPDLSGKVPLGPALRPAGGLGPVVVVQLAGSPTFEKQAELAAIGLEVLDYVPRNALLVRLGRGVDPDRLRKIAGVRAVFDYAPGFKLARELTALIETRAGQPVSSSATHRVEVSLFHGANPDALARELPAAIAGVTVAWVKRTGQARIRLLVPTASLKPVAGALARHPEVQFVEIAPEGGHTNDNSVWIGQSYDRVHGPSEAQAPDPKPYGDSATIWNQGLLGQGQIIGVFDNNFDLNLGQFKDPQRAIYPQTKPATVSIDVDLNHRKVIAVNAVDGGYDGILPHECTLHGTHTAGSVAGDCLAHAATSADPGHDLGDGMAPLAKLILQEGDIRAVQVTDVLTQQYDAGARLSSFSWDMRETSLDEGVWRHPDFTVFTGAGNDGVTTTEPFVPVPSSITSDNKNAIVVGASENYDGTLDPENMAALSSEGPTLDGRIKPDLTITGYSVRSASWPIDIYPPNDSHCDPNDPNYCRALQAGGCVVRRNPAPECGTFILSGTSMSSPTAAGLGALVREYFTSGFYPSGHAVYADKRAPSAALVKAMMINGARNMTGHNRKMNGTPIDFGPLPDAPAFKQGWGRVHLDDALYFTGDGRGLWMQDVSNPQGLWALDNAIYFVQVSGLAQAEPLKITLAWTDPPNSTSTPIVLRNDLDLIVTAPDGTVYRGNQWVDDPAVQGDKRSQSNATGRDSLNNVEGILVPGPTSGLYTVKVAGTNIPGYQEEGVYTQGFALVVTAAASGLEGNPCTTPPTLSDPQVLRFDDILLSWTAVHGATGYEIRRSTTGCGQPPSVVFAVPSGQTSYHDTTTQPAKTYSYTVRALTSADGCHADSDCKSAVTLSPPTIASLTPTYRVNTDPTTITINGTNFVATPQAYLGTATQPQKYPLPVTFVSATQVQAEVPVNWLSGTYNLKLVNPDTQTVTRNNAFTVGSPLQVTTAFTADSMASSQDLSGSLSAVALETMTLIETKNLGPNTQVVDVAVRKDGGLGLLTGYVTPIRFFTPATRNVFQTLSIQGGPGGGSSAAAAIHPSGNPAYVVTHTNSAGPPVTLRTVDLNSFSFTGALTLPHGVGTSIAVSPDGSLVFVNGANTVYVVQTSNLSLLAELTVGQDPNGMVLSTDGARLYVANTSSETVSVIDTVNRTVLRHIDVSNHTGFSNMPYTLALSTNNALLHVGNLFCCGVASNRQNVNLTNDALVSQITQGPQWVDFSFFQPNGKLYGLGFDPPRLSRLNKDTLAVETFVGVGNSSNRFAIAEPPVLGIASVNPTRSCPAGGAAITVTGSGFQGEVRDDAGNIVQARTRVLFGGTESNDVTLVNSTTLVAITPPHAGSQTPVPVLVINPNGRQATLSGVFRYFGLCSAPG